MIRLMVAFGGFQYTIGRVFSVDYSIVDYVQISADLGVRMGQDPMKFNPPVRQPIIAIPNVSLVLRMSFTYQFKAISPTVQPANQALNSADVDAPLAALLIPLPLKRKKKLLAKAIAAVTKAVDEAATEAVNKVVITAAATLKPAKKALKVKDKKPRIKQMDKMVVAIYNALLKGVKIRLCM